MDLVVDIILVVAAFGFAISTFISFKNGSANHWADNLKAKAAKKGIYTHKH